MALDAVALAKEMGFTAAAPLKPERLIFQRAVREMCAADRCGAYGRNWSCPPACGTLEEIADQAAGFSNGVLVQSVVCLEDPFDIEGMLAGEQAHNLRFRRFAEQLAARVGRTMPMAAGACTLCGLCTYPDAPCRMPEKQMRSMEACGLLVSDVCEGSGLPYYYGENTVAYVSCVLYRDG